MRILVIRDAPGFPWKHASADTPAGRGAVAKIILNAARHTPSPADDLAMLALAVASLSSDAKT